MLVSNQAHCDIQNEQHLRKRNIVISPCVLIGHYIVCIDYVTKFEIAKKNFFEENMGFQLLSGKIIYVNYYIFHSFLLHKKIIF